MIGPIWADVATKETIDPVPPVAANVTKLFSLALQMCPNKS